MTTISISTSEPTLVVGTQPWLPRGLANMTWWTRPIRAEVYALLRITTAAVLLLDQCLTMLPHLNVLYGRGSAGAPSLFAWMFERPNLHWSLLQGIADPQAVSLHFHIWMAATLGLLLGWNTRLCAIVTWVMAISFTNANVYAINAGDHIRGMVLLYLMLIPCGAVWSVDSYRMRNTTLGSPAYMVPPWALRLLLIQLAFMYCASGLCKLSGQNWLAGNSLHYVLRDLSLTRFSAEVFPLPYCVTRLATWSVLFWELLFPVLVYFRRTRLTALVAGVMMHAGIFVTMELGCFPLYLLAVYAALLLDHCFAHPNGGVVKAGELTT